MLSCWPAKMVEVGLGNQHTRKGVSCREGSKSWSFLDLENLASSWDQQTFWDSELEIQAFSIIARAASLHISQWLSACSLAIKAGFLWMALWVWPVGWKHCPGFSNWELHVAIRGISQHFLNLGVQCSSNLVMHLWFLGVLLTYLLIGNSSLNLYVFPQFGDI